MKLGYTFYIYKDKKGEYRWRLKASNGRIVSDCGEGYTRRAACTRAARAMTVSLRAVRPRIVDL